MEALPLPVLADPAPEIDPRRAWATIARSGWLILGCVLLALAAGAVAVRRMDPLYQSTASIRIDAQPGAIGPAAMYGLPTDNVNLVATAMEELHEPLALQRRRRLARPAAPARRAAAHAAQRGGPVGARRCRRAAAQLLVRARRRNNRVTVRELRRKTIGTFPIASAIALPGASVQLDAERAGEGRRHAAGHVARAGLGDRAGAHAGDPAQPERQHRPRHLRGERSRPRARARQRHRRRDSSGSASRRRRPARARRSCCSTSSSTRSAARCGRASSR